MAPGYVGTVRYPGIRIQDVRVIRFAGGSPARQYQRGRLDRLAHPPSVLAAFDLSAKSYGLNQLRYDLRRLKGHGLIERDGRRCAYRLTTRACRSRSFSCFSTSGSAVRSPTTVSITNLNPDHSPDTTYYKTDKAIQQIVDLLVAA